MAHWKLKIEKQFADEIASGKKNFEIRYENDKVFQRGDSVEFLVYPPERHATGTGVFHVPAEDHPIDGRIYEITYVLHGWGLREDYCAFAIKERVNEEPAEPKEDIVILPPEIDIKDSDTLKRSVARDIGKMCAERPSCAGCIFNKRSYDDAFVCMLRDLPGDWNI